EDDILKFGEVTVEIFSCNLDNYSDTNSYSPFILIEYKQKSFLLTGDTTSKRETEFLNDLENENRNLDIDYLLVSHHGSKYSTTAKFLNAIMPDYAFVSCEEDYYPSVEVKQRLNDVGIKEIYTTREVSTIAVGIESDSTHLVLCFDSYLDLPFVFVCMSIVCFVFLKFPTPRKLRFREKNQIFLKKMAKKAG
ncbi:MAG: hypothetical protein IJX25_01630, partial [Clostridia bacterium]|nr:hypothetical protein [Clostridia bacterium]